MRRFGESKQHEAAKERVSQVLRSFGWQVWTDNYPLECQTDRGGRVYWPDVYGENFCTIAGESNNPRRVAGQKGARRVIVEVQGSKGKGNHSTKIHRGKDANRWDDIRTAHGSDIEYYPLWDWQLKGATDLEIAQELSLSL